MVEAGVSYQRVRQPCFQAPTQQWNPKRASSMLTTVAACKRENVANQQPNFDTNRGIAQ